MNVGRNACGSAERGCGYGTRLNGLRRTYVSEPQAFQPTRDLIRV